MTIFLRALAFSLSAICIVWAGTKRLPGAEITPEQTAFFEAKIRPVLVKECYGCHSNEAGNVRGGLRLDTRQLMHIGGGSGPAIVPGSLEESLLYSAIIHEDFEMPPRRKLSADVIADFRQWIEMGAPDPRETVVGKIQSTISDEDIRQARESFWAYQPPRAQDLPSVQQTAWPRNDVDYFLLAKLERQQMKPAVDAEPYKVLRRLCFDLVGLPPTPQQVAYFEKKWDSEPDRAVAWVVDRLLEHPQFGERWGRRWLDVARYAESTGREVNMTYPHAWRYRDYVIDSFNADKPFDQFVREQIAGDLLPAGDDQQWAEQLVATTFLAVGTKNVNEQNRVQFAADVIDEQIDAVTRVFLGTSVACARCHDHKFDAIPQTDYYAMAGIFRNMTTYFGNPPSEFGMVTGVQARQSSSLMRLPLEDPNPYDKSYTADELEQMRQQVIDVRKQLVEIRMARRRDSNSAGASQMMTIRLTNQLAELSAKLAVVDAEGQPHSFCMGVQETETIKDARVLIRGEIDQPGQVVPRSFPQVLCSHSPDIAADASGRLELARWLGSDQNPLVARVMVNRVWQAMFGRGIVTSTENFGVTGARPSHPELLDHLAVQFAASRWSVKGLVRELATSRAYRMASDFDPKFHQADPDNALVWRANPRRLDAESIRDAMLSVSGELDLQRPRGSEVAKAGYVRVRNGVLGDPRESLRRQMGQQMGRGGMGRFGGPRQSRQQAVSRFRELIDKTVNALDMEDAKIRSVYLPIVRDEVPRVLEVFDFADANAIIGTRESSNTANQALYMMNNPFVLQQSEQFSRRLDDEQASMTGKIAAAFILAYGREPTSSELHAAQTFLRDFARTSSGSSERLAWPVFCQSLFASAEFRYVD